MVQWKAKKTGKFYCGHVEEVEYIAVVKCIRFFININIFDFDIDFERFLQKCNIQVSLYSRAEEEQERDL
jgi:hypothetical protein